MVAREDPDSSWNVIGTLQEDDPSVERGQEADIPTASVEASDTERTSASMQSLSGDGSPSSLNIDAFQGKKRTLPTPNSSGGPSAKRSRTLGSSSQPPLNLCQAPAPNTFAQTIFMQDGTRSLGEGDLFLSGDWRERWCLCDLCLPRLKEHPYLLKEDETYEPPEDPDSSELRSIVDVEGIDCDFQNCHWRSWDSVLLSAYHATVQLTAFGLSIT